MSEFGYGQYVRCKCVNCGNEIAGVKDMNGKIKMKCPYCGTVTVSRVMSRRHVQIDVYAPQGQSTISE